MTELNGNGCETQKVAIGIDAAIVAAHQVAIRGEGVRQDFRVPPTLAGMRALTERLRPFAGSLVVAEPTGGTWLPLSVAVGEAGCRIGFVANRDSARLRKAIAGANKTDAIDAAMLATCEQILGVMEAPAVSFGQIGLRRALRRRHNAVVARPPPGVPSVGVGSWAFPDVWRACGGHRVAQPVLGRCPIWGRCRGPMSTPSPTSSPPTAETSTRSVGRYASATRRAAGCGFGRAGSMSTLWRGR